MRRNIKQSYDDNDRRVFVISLDLDLTLVMVLVFVCDSPLPCVRGVGGIPHVLVGAQIAVFAMLLDILLVVWLLAICTFLVLLHGHHNVAYQHNVGQDGSKATSKRRVA